MRTSPKVALLGTIGVGFAAAALIFALPYTSFRTRTDSRRDLPAGYAQWAMITGFDAPIFDQFEPGRRVIGRIRHGNRVPVRPAKTERTCRAYDRQGRWLETPSGFVCTSYEMLVGDKDEIDVGPKPRAYGDRPLPFDYVKVMQVGADRYGRPRVDLKFRVESQTKAFFLAKAGVVTVAGRDWIRTARGEFTLASQTRAVHPTKLRGVELEGQEDLPLAFVVSDEPKVVRRCVVGRKLVRCGTAPKFSRFDPKRMVTAGGTIYIVDEGERLLPAGNVRIAAQIARPQGIPRDARWVHIDLDEQVFVAYEGDTPRYTSLVSTGAEGHETPTGLYQVQRKYLTKTMRGPDDTHGRYRVEEIPYVMYYKGRYAVHGAYWHDQFGNVRSHGCTNVAPADAQWLFDWDQTALPDAWHAKLDVKNGLYLYFTQTAAEGTESAQR